MQTHWRILALMGSALLQTLTHAQQGQPSIPKVDQQLLPYASLKDSVLLPDGRHLHFVCMGKGTPTVILTAGMGDLASSSWSRIQPKLARVTRVCAWDRPGFGLSDGASKQQTVDATTADLETALGRGGISSPYVLVGHSLGSYESLLFADRHPDIVVGMVLIDPSVPDQAAKVQRIAPALWQSDPENIPMVQFIRRCAAIHNASVAAGGSDPNGCFTYPREWPELLRKEFEAHARKDPLVFDSVASFMTHFEEDSALVINPARKYGSMPLQVLTATLNPLPPEAPADVRLQTPLWAAAWSQEHDKLAALSSRGINVRVPGSTHYIHQDKPQAVIDAVDSVVRQARQAHAGT